MARPTPSLIVYDLGLNRHGQQIEVREHNGLIFIEKHAANQRDDSARFEIGAGQLRTLASLYADEGQ